MTEQDIGRIERELGITLPTDYKEVVLNYPIRANRGTRDSVLYDDSAGVIELNRLYRGGLAGMAAWPRHYFFIGDDGAASCYLMDLTLSPSPVFCADHGNIKQIETESATLTGFVADYIAGLREEGVDVDAEPQPPIAPRKVALIVAVVAVISLGLGYVLMRMMAG